MSRSLGLLLLRVGTGGMLLAGHGWAKVMSFGAKAASFPDPLGIGPGVSMALAIFAEVVCSLFVILGVATRLSALPPLVTMLVAVFLVHGEDPWGEKELALLYAVPFLVLVLTGAGDFSFEAVVRRKGRHRRGDIR